MVTVAIITQALVIFRIDPFFVQVVLGLLILWAVGVNRLREVRFPASARGSQPWATGLEARGVTRPFPACWRLQDVAITMRGGSIHALLGENGAGKSTLIKIITGVHRPDEGELAAQRHAGSHFDGPRDAIAAGVGVVHQERNLIPRFSVGENILLERLDGGFSARSTMTRSTPRRAAGSTCSNSISIRARWCPQLNVAKMQMVEIAKALSLRSPRSAARRADGVADAAGNQVSVPPAAQAARRGRRHLVRQPQARGGAGDLRRGDGSARRPQRLPEPADVGARPPGSRAPDDRPQRTDSAWTRARTEPRDARCWSCARISTELGHSGIDLKLQPGRDRRPLRPGRRGTHRTRQMHPRLASR